MSFQTYYRGKTIWVTGASSGIGEQICYLLSNAGAHIILSARRKDELERVKNNCAHPDKCSIVLIDLNDETSVRKAYDEIKSQNIKIDIFFNNGGISQRSLALETPLELERKMFEVNFFSNILLSKLVGNDMLRRKEGHIVVTSTLLGKWGFHTRSSYAGSKHALHGYYDSMRMEVEDHGIHITLVTPGFIATDISKNAFDAQGHSTRILDNNQKTGMPPEECAEHILKGVAAQKKEFGVGKGEINGLWVKRYFPGIFQKILKKKSPN
jgi:dehydrogenase/reductase SDR family member 7B